MFNKEFYPTPPELVQQMIADLDLRGKCILDPSAGSGAILKRCNAAQKYAIEIEPELQAILRADKDIRVIGEDFFQYSGNIWVDAIIMNPPFSNAGKHIRRAWDLLKNGDLVSIVPATMIWNPTLEDSELISELKEAGATFEFAGSPFTDAQRKTTVEVFILRARKERETLLNFGQLRGGINSNGFSFQGKETGEIMRADMLARLTDTYTAAINKFADVLRAANELNQVLSILPADKIWKEVIVKHLDLGYLSSQAFNTFAFDVQGYIWDALFAKTHIAGMVTSKVRDDFEQLRVKAGGIDLTPENIQQVFALLLQNSGAMLQDSIEQAFDRMTKYYKNNRQSIKGYATNDAWMVKEKLILPDMVNDGFIRLSLRYQQADFCRDIDKALCLLSGAKYDNLQAEQKDENGRIARYSSQTLNDGIERACTNYHAGYGGEDESHFFRVKVFKVGTVHLWWKDLGLLEQFNAKVCQYKNWLPGDFGKSYRRRDKATEGMI